MRIEARGIVRDAATVPDVERIARPRVGIHVIQELVVVAEHEAVGGTRPVVEPVFHDYGAAVVQFVLNGRQPVGGQDVTPLG